jgi:hypothetical protein
MNHDSDGDGDLQTTRMYSRLIACNYIPDRNTVVVSCRQGYHCHRYRRDSSTDETKQPPYRTEAHSHRIRVMGRAAYRLYERKEYSPPKRAELA